MNKPQTKKSAENAEREFMQAVTALHNNVHSLACEVLKSNKPVMPLDSLAFYTRVVLDGENIDADAVEDMKKSRTIALAAFGDETDPQTIIGVFDIHFAEFYDEDEEDEDDDDDE